MNVLSAMSLGLGLLDQGLDVASRGFSATKKYLSRKHKKQRVVASVNRNSGRGAVGLRNRAYGFHWLKKRNLGV